MPQTTGSHPKAEWEGIMLWWGENYPKRKTQWTDLVDRKVSRKNREEIVQSTSFGPAVKKNQLGSIKFDENRQGFTTTAIHTTYGLGYIVSEEEQEDNLYTQVSLARVPSLMFSMGYTKEMNVANLYNNGGNSAYTFGDTKEWFSNAHPNSVGGGTFSNIITAAALSESAVEDMITQIMGATNDRGLVIGLSPTKLIVPRQLNWEAGRILKSSLQNDTANNAINVLNATGALPGGSSTNVYLNDANNWFIRTNAPAGPCLIQRRELRFEKDNDFNTGNLLAKATERYVVTVPDPRSCYASLPA